MIHSVIVDDEAKSRESLAILLKDFCDNVQVMAMCQNVDQGLKAIKEYKPDVVFLDIQMQRETGFDLLTRSEPVDFDVVFTTAHSEYAIKAFKFSAIDYLLKPINIEELKESLRRLEKKRGESLSSRLEQLIKNMKTPDARNFKLALPTLEGLVFVRTEDIIYCEASGNYTNIFTRDGRKHVVSRTLGDYEELLTDYQFFRIHHSYLINLGSIKKYIRGEGGQVVMVNEVSLDVSRRRKEAFLSKFKYR